ncbi:vWA domain-containing protein [Tropicimonas sediminicola]|uniref:Ca-activated chloride channel family protein n=1 Tax=Tropicimonas sediminicola TaxID=1031541 RepID=A0A239CIV6_9RHOB|nr:VWA domain-containing protein [Tropicimonas sediminicola]SNS19631.1 Ca-activated chloride channel family protein [Tropicimonas sediminicola]
MTDDLDRLRKALKSTPAPDTTRKAADLGAAMARFDAEFDTASESGRQENAAPVRPTSERGWIARLIDGGETMFHAMTTRAGLAATTGLVTAGLALFLVLPPETLRQPVQLGQPEQESEALAESDAPAGRSLAPAPRADTTELAPLADEAMPAPMAEVAAPMAATTALRAEAPAAAKMAADMDAAVRLAPATDTEAFTNAEANPVKVTAEEPVSTFSVDVDTASWSIVRSSLMNGQLPSPDAVRIEEMVNYFPYAYPAPSPGDAPFSVSTSLSPTPWNPDTRILQIGLQGVMPETEARPPLNLVFLIDTSGSMQGPDRLGLLAQSFRLMLGQLRPEDQVAIVTYAGSAGEVLAPTPASDRAAILGALDRLEAGGSTAGQAGLDQAYEVARGMAGAGEVTRVILATDGDFNVGPSDPEALKADVARKREDGIYLSVLGFGRGNLNDALMQALAQNGNGQAAYIDTIAEAQKVLVDQLTGQLFPIAEDVKIQLEFNPAEVAEYRLIGYETRALRREDFNNDRVDAGEIGAGHQVTALYEVTPVGSPAVLNEPLRYGPETPVEAADGELGFLRLRYKAPGEAASQLIEAPIAAEAQEADAEARFAIAIAGFGQLLRNGLYTGEWSWGHAIALAEGARGEDRFGYRSEALRLMRLAETLDAAR